MQKEKNMIRQGILHPGQHIIHIKYPEKDKYERTLMPSDLRVPISYLCCLILLSYIAFDKMSFDRTVGHVVSIAGHVLTKGEYFVPAVWFGDFRITGQLPVGEGGGHTVNS